MLDCLIVGSGPAGISAALTLQANGKTFKIFGSKSLSTKITKAEKIHNYPALTDVSGEEFADALKSQLDAAGIEIVEERVGGVYAMKDKFILSAGQNSYAVTNITETSPNIMACPAIILANSLTINEKGFAIKPNSSIVCIIGIGNFRKTGTSGHRISFQ